jgi:hypothetical protein
MKSTDRFFKKVRRDGDCWMWTGAVVTNGYGQFYIGKPVSAHRAAWLLFRGPIPSGSWVLHRCDQKRCVNPDHLYLGTARDNARDAVERGQYPSGERHGSRTHLQQFARGERHGSAKLRESDVLAIRSAFSSGAGIRSMARDYNVSEFAIHAIVYRKTWVHI